MSKHTKFTTNHHSVQLYNQFHTVEFRPRRTKFREGFPTLSRHLINKRWSYSDAVFHSPRAVSNKETITWNVTIEKLANDRPPGKELEIGFSLTSCTPTKLSTFSKFSDLTEIGKIGFRKRNQDCVVLSSSGWLAAGGLPKDRISDAFVQGDRVTINLDFREGNGFYEFLKNGVSFGAMPYDVNTERR